MGGPATRVEVVERRRTEQAVRLDVVVLSTQTVATVRAHHAVEARRLAQLERDAHLDRGVAGPPPHLSEVLAVVEDPGEKRVLGDLLGDLRGHRSDSGDLADFALLDFGPAARGDLV